VGKNVVDRNEKGDDSYNDLKEDHMYPKPQKKRRSMLCVTQITRRWRKKIVDSRFNGSAMASTKLIREKSYLMYRKYKLKDLQRYLQF